MEPVRLHEARPRIRRSWRLEKECGMEPERRGLSPIRRMESEERREREGGREPENWLEKSKRD